MVDLTQIMRQKDDLIVFVVLLNRICIKQKAKVLSDHNRVMLRQVVKDIKDYPLHAFCTIPIPLLRSITMPSKSQPDRSHFYRDLSDGSMVETGGFIGKKRDLPDMIEIAVGISVMWMWRMAL